MPERLATKSIFFFAQIRSTVALSSSTASTARFYLWYWRERTLSRMYCSILFPTFRQHLLTEGNQQLRRAAVRSRMRCRRTRKSLCQANPNVCKHAHLAHEMCNNLMFYLDGIELQFSSIVNQYFFNDPSSNSKQAARGSIRNFLS